MEEENNGNNEKVCRGIFKMSRFLWGLLFFLFAVAVSWGAALCLYG